MVKKQVVFIFADQTVPNPEYNVGSTSDKDYSQYEHLIVWERNYLGSEEEAQILVLASHCAYQLDAGTPLEDLLPILNQEIPYILPRAA